MIVVWLAALALLALALVLVVAYGIARRVTKPARHTYWDEYSFTPADMGAPYQPVSFTTADGIRLSAWLLQGGPGQPTIILGSGYRERKVTLLPLAAGLWRRGCNVLLMDFRNQGDSAGDTALTMGLREVRDLRAAVDFVAGRLGGAIGAMGWSMGGVVSILAAAEDKRIGAVVADSAYAGQSDVIDHMFHQYTGLPAALFTRPAELFFGWLAGYRPSQVRPEEAIGRISPRPVLIIHGEQDDICPIEQGRRLYARAGEPKELWIDPKAKHVGVYFRDPEAYLARVAHFFERALGG